MDYEGVSKGVRGIEKEQGGKGFDDGLCEREQGERMGTLDGKGYKREVIPGKGKKEAGRPGSSGKGGVTSTNQVRDPTQKGPDPFNAGKRMWHEAGINKLLFYLGGYLLRNEQCAASVPLLKERQGIGRCLLLAPEDCGISILAVTDRFSVDTNKLQLSHPQSDECDHNVRHPYIICSM